MGWLGPVGDLAGGLRLIEREGPTGLIVTTTATRLHPENETRWLSTTVSDSPEQTRNVFRRIADERRNVTSNLAAWIALQEWLDHGEKRVTIPYAEQLAELVETSGVRLRRDFGKLLDLIRAHALLHRQTRGRDAEGRIIATLADYEAVRELVADLIADGVEASIPPRVRETVKAVADIVAGGAEHATGQDLVKKLRLDKSAVSRRVQDAIGRDYIRNAEDRRGKPAKYGLGAPLPDEIDILPTVDRLESDPKSVTLAILRCYSGGSGMSSRTKLHERRPG